MASSTSLSSMSSSSSHSSTSSNASLKRIRKPSPYKQVYNFVRAFFTTLYLLLIVLTVPIAFQVGGVYCGLTFTVTLFCIYSSLTVIRLVLYRNWVVNVLYYSQHLLIPSILTFSLSVFNNNDMEQLKLDHIVYYKFFIKPWMYVIQKSTPWFTLLEGLCTVLAIQSIGQTFTWLKLNKSESWVIVSLLSSGGIITTSMYFLYRIYSSSVEISSASASLIGAILTFCCGVGLYGIISKRGSTVESSLLFAYVVRCIYETFPELSLLASNEMGILISSATNQIRLDVQFLPLLLTDSVTHLVSSLTWNVPVSFQAVLDFFIAAAKTVTPTVLVNLAYRVSVFYSATRIIPALKNPQPSTRSMRIIYAFSPCIIIAVYTHLMMQYSNELDSELCIWGWWLPLDKREGQEIVVDPWLFWNWINMFSTLGLYALELFSDPQEWKG